MKHFLAAALLSIIPTSTLAQDVEYWGSSGDWDIYVDPAVGNGCLMENEYLDGTIVRIGYDRNEDAGFVSAYNYAWSNIRDDQSYAITLDLDGWQYGGEAYGIFLGNMPGYDFYFYESNLFTDIGNSNAMTLFSDYGEEMSVSLRGSTAALHTVLQCQDQMGHGGQGQTRQNNGFQGQSGGKNSGKY